MYWSEEPVEGESIGLAATGFYPPEMGMGADEYRGYLRARWRQEPERFVALARRAAVHDVTLVGPEPFIRVLQASVVAVGERQGWRLDGGQAAPRGQSPAPGTVYANLADSRPPPSAP